MIGRLSKGLVRACLIVLLVATPALMIPATNSDTAQVVILCALVAGALTCLEYAAASPSLVEFRDAPPYNRIRYVALFVTVLALSGIARSSTDPSTFTRLLVYIGDSVAVALDFPYSPVRLVVLMMPPGADPALVDDVRTAAGLSYLVSILSLAWFALVIWLRNWPVRRAGFNLWVNLPTFDPTAGGDVARRLGRDAQINLILGFLLPFMIPAVVKLVGDVIDPAALHNPHVLIWMMAAWAFLPASLLMRGIALSRVTQLIVAQRRRAHGAAAQALRHA